MWLRHFIEHLMCIGGELEHPNALPSPARKNRALWSALLWRWGIYRQLIGPGSWPVRGELCGALAHLLCTRGVRWNARARLLKISPLQARPPSSIFLNICLGLAVRHVPSPSSPPSIARADLVAGTTVVSLLFLSSF